MSTKRKIFLSCEEASHYCDKNQYKEATLWENVKLGIHLIYCRVCQKYAVKNTRLSKMMKDPKVIYMNPTAKNEMKKELEKLIKKEMN